MNVRRSRLITLLLGSVAAFAMMAVATPQVADAGHRHSRYQQRSYRGHHYRGHQAGCGCRSCRPAVRYNNVHHGRYGRRGGYSGYRPGVTIGIGYGYGDGYVYGSYNRPSYNRPSYVRRPYNRRHWRRRCY